MVGGFVDMAKVRSVDYSADDMLKLTGLTRNQFRDALLRFCDLYDFDITDFKVDETKEKGYYFFPPEIAEPVALLLKHIAEHPLRRNADPANITASAVAKYNEAELDDIDNNIGEYFYKVIYSLKDHLVAREWVAG